MKNADFCDRLREQLLLLGIPHDAGMKAEDATLVLLAGYLKDYSRDIARRVPAGWSRESALPTVNRAIGAVDCAGRVADLRWRLSPHYRPYREIPGHVPGARVLEP